jgi:hypothetical protein
MKPQTGPELDIVCDALNPKDEHVLTQIFFDQDQMGLLFESASVGSHWLWVDFRAPTFSMLVIKKPIGLKKSKIKPIYTFLKTHGLNKQLTRLERDHSKGRVVHLSLENLEIELRMIKNQKNIVLQLSDSAKLPRKKPVSLYKMAELPQNIQAIPTAADAPARDLQAMVNEWMASQMSKKIAQHNTSLKALIKNDESDGERALRQKLEKLKKSIEQIQKVLENDESQLWQAAGDWLKNNPKEKPPLEHLRFISPKKSFSENVQHIFTQAKKIKANFSANRDRVLQLKKELAHYETVSDPDTWLAMQQKKKLTVSVKIAEVPHKQMRLSSGHPLVVGKSARHNLDLLRAANPWDLWIHLKDFPSAHGVITKNKSEVLTDAVLNEAARQLIESSMKKRLELIKGEKFVVIVAEKRFVKPIKGSVGLVEYQSEKTFAILF